MYEIFGFWVKFDARDGADVKSIHLFLKILFIENTWQNSVKFIKKLEWALSIATHSFF